LIGLALGAVGALALMLFIADVADQDQGCGSIDPTDPANYSSVSLLNDTNSLVVVDQCKGSYCSGSGTPVSLPPGQELPEHAACGASGGHMTSWRITHANGALLGYIAVDTPRKHDGLIYPVSRASRDRRTPTPAK